MTLKTTALRLLGTMFTLPKQQAVPKLYLGSTPITLYDLGSTPISHIYLGSTPIV